MSYAYLKGELIEVTPHHAIIENSGIGYLILIPVDVYSTLVAKIGKPILLYTQQVIREDSHRLFGFLTTEKRDLFKRVCDITGIGPKTALLLIGHLSTDELHLAIHQNDITTISRVPGIGKKTAERLIIEMRDKVSKQSILPPQSPASDALSALVNLGYQQTHASKALQKITAENSDLALPDLITRALKIL
ncbi:MAG: Holliday junction branch migration protein RuvA [Simkaniaceae bacterium]|nr:Holliday junction branch migration protein RuvA [Simkaniaceae bacterium]